MVDDPAYANPLPAEQYLDEAARLSGFADWFAVPSLFRTPINRHVIVNARLLEIRARTALSQHRGVSNQGVRASAQEGTALSSQATEPQASPPCGLQSTDAWQPIDTAPKDRPILVWYDHDADPYRDPANPDVLTTYACHAEAGDFLDGKGVTIARWCEAYEESNGWEAGDSWWMPAVWCAWFNNDNADQVCNPTHWMPLPEAPRS